LSPNPTEELAEWLDFCAAATYTESSNISLQRRVNELSVPLDEGVRCRPPRRSTNRARGSRSSGCGRRFSPHVRVRDRRCLRSRAPCGDKIRRQLRQPVLATFCPAVFDRYILPFRIAVFAQSLAERSDKTGRTGQATPSSGTRSPASLSAARERLVRPSCRSPALGAARGVSSEHHVGAPGVTHVLPVRRRIRLSLVRFFEDATDRGPT